MRRIRRGLAGGAHAGSGRTRREPADRGSPSRPARVRALQWADRRRRRAEDGAGDEGLPAARRAGRRWTRRRAGPAARRALGPLATPVLGRRTLHRGLFGCAVSVLQFMLARRGELVPVYGFFDRATERALRRYQRARRLAADGIAGPVTLSALGHRTPGVRPVRAAPAPTASVRTMLTNWAIAYRLDPTRVRALAWMESGYQPGLVSSAGARGVLQVLPSTRSYVQSVLIGHKVPNSTSGNTRIGVAYLRELLREFHGNRARALAAWYQGPFSVHKRGQLAETRLFVRNVLALLTRRI